MRLESLYDALAYFPDVDGFWHSNSLAETEAQIRSNLPGDWATNWNQETIQLLTQLARVQALQGQMPAAKASLETGS